MTFTSRQPPSAWARRTMMSTRAAACFTRQIALGASAAIRVIAVGARRVAYTGLKFQGTGASSAIQAGDAVGAAVNAGGATAGFLEVAFAALVHTSNEELLKLNLEFILFGNSCIVCKETK